MYKTHFNLHSKYYYASGGFGDALMVLNKFKSLKLHRKNCILHFYTDKDEIRELIQNLFEINHIRFEIFINAIIPPILEEHKKEHNIITTSCNGKISKTDPDSKLEDDYAIQPFFNIETIQSLRRPAHPYFILQTTAGLREKNEKNKKWIDVHYLEDLIKNIKKFYKLECYVIGSDLENIQEKNISFLGLETIDWIKHAQFVIGLSSFVTLCSLMSGVPTIYKIQDEKTQKHYYDVSEWSNKLNFPIEEITTNTFKQISSFIEPHLKLNIGDIISFNRFTFDSEKFIIVASKFDAAIQKNIYFIQKLLEDNTHNSDAKIEELIYPQIPISFNIVGKKEIIFI